MHRFLWTILTIVFLAGTLAAGEQYYISATANAGGTVSPREGKNFIPAGQTADLTLTARQGYYLRKVTIDGAPAVVPDRSASTFRFPDVRSNHKLVGTFARNPAISVSYTKGGSIDSGKGKVFLPYSTGRTFRIIPAEGYHVSAVKVDGEPVGAVGEYSFAGVTSGHSLKAAFAINTYDVGIEAGAGGKITPPATKANHGQTRTFTVDPDPGMKVGTVTINGEPAAGIPETGIYRFRHLVTGPVRIAATFADAPAAARFRKSPYLLYAGNNTSMQLLWQTTGTTGATVSWGTDTSYSLGSTPVAEATTDHVYRFTVPELTPGTKYYYRVALTGTEATGSFYAAPAANATSVKLFVFGDTRTNASRHDGLAGLMMDEYVSDPAFQSLALITGDMVSDGDSESSWSSELFAAKFAKLAKFSSEVPRQIVRGNHEGSAKLFKKYFPYPYLGGTYWSFDYGPVHVAVTDQYRSGTFGTEQLQWLANDLAGSNKPWKIIMVHEPAWSAGGGHENDGATQRAIQPLAKEHGAIVFSGHNHYYSRAVVDGINHITTGGGGAPLHTPDKGRQNIVTADRSNHVCMIDIAGDTLSFRALRADGTLIETFTLNRTAP